MSAFHYLARPRKINVCVHVYYRKKQGRGSSINNVRTWGGLLSISSAYYIWGVGGGSVHIRLYCKRRNFRAIYISGM